MSRRPVLVLGAGSHASVVAEAMRLGTQFEPAYCLDPIGKIDPAPGFAPLLRGMDELATIRERGVQLAVPAVGDNSLRREVAEAAKEAGCELVAVVHPQAFVAPSAKIAPGAVVLVHAVVGTNTVVKEGAVVNTAASLDHDNVLGEYAFVAPGVHFGGHVTIGEEAMIGIGASVIQGVTIGRNSVVAGGAVVIRDVMPDTLVVGVPATERKRI